TRGPFTVGGMAAGGGGFILSVVAAIEMIGAIVLLQHDNYSARNPDTGELLTSLNQVIMYSLVFAVIGVVFMLIAGGLYHEAIRAEEGLQFDKKPGERDVMGELISERKSGSGSVRQPR